MVSDHVLQTLWLGFSIRTTEYGITILLLSDHSLSDELSSSVFENGYCHSVQI